MSIKILYCLAYVRLDILYDKNNYNIQVALVWLENIYYLSLYWIFMQYKENQNIYDTIHNQRKIAAG